MKTRVDQIRVGKVRPFGPNGESSAYRKTEVSGSVAIRPLGLAGDEQADLEHHGGVDKAILHYAHDHYADWLGEHPELGRHLDSPGAFGENISTTGLIESEVCVGDRFRLGTAVVEVSQGRQPCWKLGHRFGSPDMVRHVVRTGRGGWYYRVVEPGQVRAGDAIELMDRPCPEWPVSAVFGLLVGNEHDSEAFAALIDLESLSANWRKRAERKLRNAASRGAK